MTVVAQKSLLRRPPVILAILVTLAVLGFIIVGRLVSLYRVRQRELARGIYRQGLADQQTGRPLSSTTPITTSFSSASVALRGTGGLDEAESYLLTLWERSPQDSTINLALGRLAARRGFPSINCHTSILICPWTLPSAISTRFRSCPW